jgi:predicted  nucleic acid-binding Zn-ribbon protein
MSMWLYDDLNEMQEFKNLQNAVKQLEKEYLDLRTQLRDTEVALRTDQDSDYLTAKVKYLKKRITHIEKQGPRFADDHPLEISLFGPPHG